MNTRGKKVAGAKGRLALFEKSITFGVGGDFPIGISENFEKFSLRKSKFASHVLRN